MAATEMDADDEILRKLASGAAIDYSTWPVVLADIVARIEKAARNDFPIPRLPQPKQAEPLPEPRLLDPLPSSDPIAPSAEASSATAVGNDDSQRSSSQETNKENTNPVPAAAAATSQPTTAAATQPTTNASAPQDPTALPPQIISLMNDITTTLTTSFPVYPPHTAQRLAELVLAPRQHYRSLPSYLHALDRVVHVTSGSNVFPLPPAVPDMSTMTLMSNGPARDGPWVNGTSSPASSSTPNALAPINVGSDEALGGALLTPIPWLHHRTASSSVSGGSSSPPEPDPAQLATGQQSPQQQQTGGTPGAGGAGQSQAQQGQGQGGNPFEGQVHTETTETIEGPNGMGSIETVSISVNGIPSHGATVQLQRGVTQGELLRQEQRAGVVPVTQLARASMPATAGPIGLGSGAGGNNASPSTSSPGAGSSTAVQAQAGAAGDEDTAMPDEDAADPGPTSSTSATAEQDDASTTDKPAITTSSEEDSPEQQQPHQEIPHARGPEEIGAADMGPQKESSSTFVTSPSGAVEMHGIDVAAAVGRSKADDTQQQPRKSKSKSPEAAAGGNKEGDEVEDRAAATERARRATTPKREAEGGPDDAAEPAAKRLREDEGAGAAAGAGGDEGAKKDAEGDTVLTDQAEEGGKGE